MTIVTTPVVIADDLMICHACACALANGPCDGCESCAFSDASDCSDTAAVAQYETWGDAVRGLTLACDDNVCDHDRDGRDRGRSIRVCDGCGRERTDWFHGAAVFAWPSVAD